MKKKINLLTRMGLFAAILSLGTLAALTVGEARGLALADLSGAPVRAMATAAHGDVLYAALSGGRQPAGIYRSQDRGDTWQQAGSGPGAAVRALAVRPAEPQGEAEGDVILYAGTSGGPTALSGGLWRSDDGGWTWHSSTPSLATDPDGLPPAVSALAVDPRQPGVLYVGTEGQGVYRFESEGKGDGYQLVGGVSLGSLHNAYVKHLVVGPEGRVYALTNDGLFVHHPPGDSQGSDGDAWQKLAAPEMTVSLAVAPEDPQTLYAGSASTGVYRSSDGGQSWERVGAGLDMLPGAALRVTALTVDEGHPGRVVAATAYGLGGRLAPDGIYQSTDGGRRWTRLADAGSVVTQLFLDQGVITAATEDGLARYGEPIEPRPATALPRLRSLANPSHIQALILILTTALAGLSLAGRAEWLMKMHHPANLHKHPSKREPFSAR